MIAITSRYLKIFMEKTPALLFENDHYIGFFKPSGIPTTYGKTELCFLDDVRKEYPKLFSFSGYSESEGGLLYRLDNDTSGILLFAKNREAFQRFIGDSELKKVYVAEIIDERKIVPAHGIISHPIIHKSSKKMAALIPGKKVNYNGQPIHAETAFERIKGDFYRVFITKGARHQIRVHFASFGAPLFGDSLYGRPSGEELHLACMGIRSSFLNIDLLTALKPLVSWIRE